MSQMFQFGSGLLTAVRTDASGVQTPRRFGTLQDVSVEFNGEVKELFGQYQFPVDTARGKTKIAGKAKLANIDTGMYNDLFFGQTLTTGSTQFVFNEAHSVPSSPGPYTVVVTNTTGTTADYGVFYSTSGDQLTRVAAGSEATGSYSFDGSTDTYTFASGDADAALLFNYTYQPATGHNIAISGQKFMGNTPTFSLVLYQTFETQQMVLELYKCVSTRLTYPTRIDDYVISDFDFSAFSNAAGNVGKFSVSN